jgi:4-amino-4-deoxy-L-arabinose transferase-like glycosyltransferase
VKLREILNRPGALVLIAMVAISAFFLFDLGGRWIASPDEGRYIEIPREMAETGDYVLPRLNGILYFEKPPLFYWMEASAIKAFGFSEWSMRLWPALLGLFGCLMTYGVGRRFYGRDAGLIASGILATSLLYYGLARFVIIDMAVSILMSAALFAFLLSAEEEDERKAIWWARGGHAAAALAVLAKGLIGLVLPGLVGLVWIALIGRWSFVRRAFAPTGIAVFLIIVVPWHVLAAMRNHDFLWFYFVHEQFLRYTTTIHRRGGSIAYFIPVLAAGFLPWTGYLWNGLKEALPKSWAARGERPVDLFLFVWAVVIFCFFSVSDSKLPPYILPIFPPLALLAGRAIAARLNAPRDDLPAGRWIFVGFFGLVGLAVPVAYRLAAVRGNEDIGPYMDVTAPYIYSLAVVFVVGALAAIILPQRFGQKATVAVVFITAALAWSGVSLVSSVVNPNSIKSVAETVKALRQHGETVASYDTLFYDLPVYIGDKVLVVNNHAEFDFGMTQEDTSAYVMDDETFSRKWDGAALVFLVTRTRTVESWAGKGRYAQSCVIARSDRAVAFVNRPELLPGGPANCLAAN